MPLVTVLTQDSRVRRAVVRPLDDEHCVALARSWERLSWLVKERPVTAVVLDSAALPDHVAQEAVVTELGRRYPSLATLLVVRPRFDPLALFRLGRAGLGNLVLLPLDELVTEVEMQMRRALSSGTEAIVTRAVSPCIPPEEVAAVRLALEGVQRGWSAEALASRVGLSRPHLSVRLRACGLPSAGRLLVWAKLLHAGRWLTDPGRTAQSVSRQLDYSSGAAFRRALRHYTRATPLETRARGGLRLVLTRFLDVCGLVDRVSFDRSVA